MEDETDEPSGTEVRINIKDRDQSKIKSALQQQLKYFDRVKYVNCDISNDYKIIKGNHFIHRLERNKSKYDDDKDVHLCLGKVRYPIDSDLIGRYRLNIGLYFDIGEIRPVWNRENIEYTDETVDKIKEKVKLAREELQQLYNKQNEDVDSIEKLLKYKETKNLIPLYEEGEEVEGIYTRDNFIDTKNYYPKYDTLKVKNDSNLYSGFSIDKSFSSYRSYGTSTFYGFKPFDIEIFLMDKGQNYSDMKTEYIKENYESGVFLRPRNKKAVVRDLMNSFFTRGFTQDPYDYDKEVRQQVIKEAYELYEEMNDFIDRVSTKYSDVEVTEEFEEKYIAEKKAEKKRKEEIFHYLRVQTKGSFNRNRINGNTLKSKFGEDTVIYGFQDDRSALKEVKSILKSELSWREMDYIHVIQISMKNEQVVREVLPDTVYYVKEVDKIRIFRKISNKYNQQAFINDLKRNGINAPSLKDKHIPNYITPEEPTEEEKRQVYKMIGKYHKYPLLHYTHSAPDEYVEEYKQNSKYHNINPILIGKKHIRDNYEESNSTEE